MKTCPKCGKEYKDTSTLCPVDGAVLARVGETLVGATLADKYRVEEFLSEGGMGAVYRGTHILMDKTVAIKVLHPALAADDTIVARFSREARAASRISHPHALNVTDFGEAEDGVVFLVMEFLKGRTLKEIIKSEGPMSLPRVVEIMRQVCGALEAAHTETVVHRDMKSDNIMLIDVGGGDWVKVLDFGIAKIQESAGQDPEITAANLIVGTPQYMSPEQCQQSSEIDARSDIYSLGVVLYEMLAGHVPFTGESPTHIMMKHLQEEPPDLLQERSDLPPEVGRVVARALAKLPEHRFQKVGELAESLTAAAAEGALAASTTGGTTSQMEKSITDRIVVPTNPNRAAEETIAEDYDEVTVVRSSVPPAIAAGYPVSASPPAPRDTSNSWRIAAIALIGVLVLGGVLFALTRTRPQGDETQTPLTVDPNSQPVQPAGPPTGQREQGISPNMPPTSSNANENTNANTPGANENTDVPGGPADDVDVNDNSQTNGNVDSEPPKSNSNSNQNNNLPPAKVTPPRVIIEDPPPPPLPTPTGK